MLENDANALAQFDDIAKSDDVRVFESPREDADVGPPEVFQRPEQRDGDAGTQTHPENLDFASDP